MERDLFSAITKFPFATAEGFFDSNELKQNKTCAQKCTDKDCLKLLEQSSADTSYICHKGYNNFGLQLGLHKYVLNGLILKENTTVPAGRKEARTDWIVDQQSIEVFIGKVTEVERHLVLRENETTVKNFSIFHDFKTSLNIFYSCTQEIIDNLPGETFEEKLRSSDTAHRGLYDALRLITSQLRMIDIVINPKSIEFGNKKQINLYKLFDKMQKLFSHLIVGKKNIDVKIVSEARIKDSLCYDSIEFIPLILLDNALKYSSRDSTVEIKLEQHGTTVKTIVKNIGPLVPDENRERIFEKFYRDEFAMTFAKEGIGVGLWIAQEILKAHSSRMHYFKDPNAKGQIGLNIFSFDLPTVSQYS